MLDVRLASIADSDAIARLSRSEIEYGLAWSWTPERVRIATRNDDTNVIVAVEGKRVLGFGIMVYRDTSAHLSLLAVHPEHRRRQVASTLLAWLEQVALVAGVQRIGLEARRGNRAALAFYERHGYVPIDVVAGMYQGLEDGVRFEKRLAVDPAGDSAAPTMRRRAA